MMRVDVYNTMYKYLAYDKPGSLTPRSVRQWLDHMRCLFGLSSSSRTQTERLVRVSFGISELIYAVI